MPQSVNKANSHILATGLLVWLAAGAVLAVVQFAIPDLAGRDGYYHIKLASLMRSEGLTLQFPWLPLSVLSAGEYVNHHFLFHILLIPFTFGDLILGAKLAAVVFGATAFAALWWLLANQRVPYAWAWALGGLALSEAFIYRLSMPRAQSLSLVIILLAMHFLFEQRLRALFIIGFAYVWLYDAFPLLIVVVLAHAAAVLAHTSKVNLRPLAYACGGILAGLVINPYFPKNLLFIARHLLPKLSDATSISVGSEWYPYDTGQLFANSWPVLVLLAVAIFALGWRGKRMSLRATTALLQTLAFGLLLFQARRFIEYFPAIALTFCAFSLSGITIDYRKSLARRARPWLAPAAAIVAVSALAFTTISARATMRSSAPAERYAGAAAWLQANTPQGSLVFQSDWDDFPELFFHNHHNIYLAGLDPTYMQLYDAAIYDLWVDTTQGDVADLSATITERFGARWAFTDLEHDAFIRAARNDPQMVEVYRDEYAVVYAIEGDD